MRLRSLPVRAALGCLVFLLPPGAAAAGQWSGDLLLNGDFEEGEREPTGWREFNPFKGEEAKRISHEWVTTGASSGSRCIRLESELPTRWPNWSQQAPVGEGIRCRLTVSVRSEGVERSCGVSVFFLDAGGRKLSSARAASAKDEHVWKRFEKEFVTPEGTREVRVLLDLNGRGRVWFDGCALSREAVALTPALASGRSVFLSDARTEEVRQDGPPLGRGCRRSFDGGVLPLTLGGMGYRKGLGAHANSRLVFELGGKGARLLGRVGLDSGVTRGGSVTFAVDGDGRRLYESGPFRPGTAPEEIDLEVRGVKRLVLSVGDAGDGTASDCGDWADLQVIPSGGEPLPSSAYIPSSVKIGFAVRRIPLPSPFWSMAAEFDEGPRFYGGTMDGRLVCVDADGKLLWGVDVGGVPSAVAVGDADGDGRDEVAATCLVPEKNVLLFSGDGRLLSSTTLAGTARCACFVPGVDGRGELLAVGGDKGRIVLYDATLSRVRELDYGGAPIAVVRTVCSHESTLLVAGNTGGGVAAFDVRGRRLWSKAPLGWPLGNLVAADLDGDGREEIVVPRSEPGDVAVLAADGRIIWKRTRLVGDAVRLVAADIMPTEGLELIAFDNSYRGHSFCVFTSGGELLRRTGETNPPNVLLADPAGKRLWAASAGPRDPTLYEIRITDSDTDELAKIRPPSGPEENARKLLRLAEECPPSGLRGRRICVQIDCSPHADFGDRYRAFRKLNGERFEFQLEVDVRELGAEYGPRHVRNAMDADAIAAVASHLEREHIPFFFSVGHWGRIGITLEAARRALEAAPTWSRGFVFKENFAHFPSKRWRRFEDRVAEFLKLAHGHGKKVVLQELLDTWHHLPADPSVHKRWFSPEHRSSLVPVYRTNNPHAPEWVQGGCVGLFSAGLVDDWGISPQYWNWNWEQTRRTGVFPDDVMLRFLVTATALGATYIHMEGGQPMLAPGGLGPEHWRPFYALVNRGWLLPPARGELVSLAPFAFRMRLNPAFARGGDERLGASYSRTDREHTEGILHPRFALERTKPQYVSNLLYTTRLYCEAHFPRVPYGFVPVVPEVAGDIPLPGSARMVLTDGYGVFEGGKRLEPLESVAHLERICEGLAGHTEVRCAEAFLAARRVGKRTVLVLADPTYPGAKETRAEIVFRKAPRTLRDALDGRPVRVRGRRARVVVPAGSVRILVAEGL